MVLQLTHGGGKAMVVDQPPIRPTHPARPAAKYLDSTSEATFRSGGRGCKHGAALISSLASSQHVVWLERPLQTHAAAHTMPFLDDLPADVSPLHAKLFQLTPRPGSLRNTPPLPIRAPPARQPLPLRRPLTPDNDPRRTLAHR